MNDWAFSCTMAYSELLKKYIYPMVHQGDDQQPVLPHHTSIQQLSLHHMTFRGTQKALNAINIIYNVYYYLTL